MSLTLPKTLGLTAVLSSGVARSPLVVLVSDSFNRPDDAASLGTAETGQVWNPLVGTWGIISGQAYSDTTGTPPRAVVDAGLPDQQVSCTIAGGSVAYARLIARVTDVNNDFTVYVGGGTWWLGKRVAGSITAIGDSGIVAAVGDRVSLLCQGTKIELRINGAFGVSATETHSQAATQAGVQVAGGAPSRVLFDNFEVDRL